MKAIGIINIEKEQKHLGRTYDAFYPSNVWMHK
jgi:hypothetical protein